MSEKVGKKRKRVSGDDGGRAAKKSLIEPKGEPIPTFPCAECGKEFPCVQMAKEDGDEDCELMCFKCAIDTRMEAVIPCDQIGCAHPMRKQDSENEGFFYNDEVYCCDCGHEAELKICNACEETFSDDFGNRHGLCDQCLKDAKGRKGQKGMTWDSDSSGSDDDQM